MLLTPAGLHPSDASLGTSTSSVSTGASQSGLRGLAGVGTVGHVSRTGSLGGINDLGHVVTSVRAPTVTPTHLCDVTADQLGLTSGGVGGGVSVIGIGNFPNVSAMGAMSSVGSMGVVGMPCRTLTETSGLSAASHQPLQVMPGAGVAARTHSPHLSPDTWNTRL